MAMAGDGINHAPARAQAQVGIVIGTGMGTGTDVAMESAGVTRVKGDLQGIARARFLSRAAMRNIKASLCIGGNTEVIEIGGRMVDCRQKTKQSQAELF